MMCMRWRLEPFDPAAKIKSTLLHIATEAKKGKKEQDETKEEKEKEKEKP